MAEKLAQMNLPRDLQFDWARHMWVRPVPGSPIVYAGLDAIGLDAIGELAYVQCAPPGTTVRRGAPMGSLEAAKMTDTLIAPVSGRIVAVNEAVMMNPSLLNRDPYGEGWLVAIETECWAQERTAFISGPQVDARIVSESAGLQSDEAERP